MSDLRQAVDGSVLDDKQTKELQSATAGMCSGTPLQYPRKRREHWPFLYYEENGQFYLNDSPRNTRKLQVQALNLEDALW